jgi:hypothetical protein
MRAKVSRTARRNDSGMVISMNEGRRARKSLATEARDTPLPITRSVSLSRRLKSTIKVKRIRLSTKLIPISLAIYV